MSNYRQDPFIYLNGMTGMDSHTGNGSLLYTIYSVSLIGSNPIKTIVEGPINTAVYESSPGNYVIAGGITVPYNTTYYVEWTDTSGNFWGVSSSQYNNQANDIINEITAWTGATPAQIAAAVLQALATPYTNTITGSLGTSVTITSYYSSFQAPNNFIIQAGSQYPVFSCICSYQGTQIIPSSAVFRVWKSGDPFNLISTAMTVNSDNSLTYNFASTDLTMPGEYNFEVTVTDTSGRVIPCPYVQPGQILVTPNV